MLRTKSA